MREDRRSRKDCERDADCPEPHLSTSVKSGNRTKMRGRPARKIEHHFIDVTPAPPFRRIIGLNDRVPGRVKMFCCVPVWRLIAATDMATGAANPQMQPGVTRFQAFLTPRALGTTSRIAERCLQNIAMFSRRAIRAALRLSRLQSD